MKLFRHISGLILITVFGSSAYAGKYNGKLSEMRPPKARAAQKRQVLRADDILIYKFKGYIGEADSGFLAIRELKDLNETEKKKIKNVVAAENNDRSVVYREIILFNKLNKEKQAMLIKNAYEVYRNTSAKGTFYLENKIWQKHF